MQTYDLKDANVRELNQALHMESADNAEIRVTHPNGKHSVAVGAMYPGQIDIEGHVGYYCAGMNQHANVTVHGNAGSGCAENMMSGHGARQGQCLAILCGDRARRDDRDRGRYRGALRDFDERCRYRGGRIGRQHVGFHGAKRPPGDLRQCG